VAKKSLLNRIIGKINATLERFCQHLESRTFRFGDKVIVNTRFYGERKGTVVGKESEEVMVIKFITKVDGYKLITEKFHVSNLTKVEK